MDSFMALNRDRIKSDPDFLMSARFNGNQVSCTPKIIHSHKWQTDAGFLEDS
jgi:hypothetical protein